MAIKKAVIPMAGMGTRMRPITHVVPKEFLPILTKPLFHYIVDEVIAAGCEELVCVVPPGRDFATPYAKAMQLPIRLTTIPQERPGGLGQAVGCAESAIGDEPFFVLLPDVIFDAPLSVCQQMAGHYQRIAPAGIIAARPEPREKISSYGVIASTEDLSAAFVRISDLVEKPPVDQAPSNLTIAGRYLLPPSIFRFLRTTKPGAKGEIQLTDALREVIHAEGLYSLRYQETAMFDAGQLPGWLAANHYFARKEGL